MAFYDREADATRVLLVGQSPDGGVTPGPVLLFSAGADGRANTEKGQIVDARGAIYNGTTWDRQRSASGDGLAATGVPAAGLLGFNGTTWDRLRVNPLRDLLVQQRDLIPISATGVAGASVTLTIPSGGAGIFNYLVYLQLVLYATAAMAGAAAPFVVTTTGLPNTPSFTFPTALAIGQTAEQKIEGGVPIKGSAAATSLTVVAPAATGGIWRITAAYFQA